MLKLATSVVENVFAPVYYVYRGLACRLGADVYFQKGAYPEAIDDYTQAIDWLEDVIRHPDASEEGRKATQIIVDEGRLRLEMVEKYLRDGLPPDLSKLDSKHFSGPNCLSC